MKKYLFFRYAEELYRRRYASEEISYHTWYNSQHMLSLFRDYCLQTRKRSNLRFRDIDVSLIQDYKNHCLEARGNSPLSVSRKLVPIFQVLKNARADGLISSESCRNLQLAYMQMTPRRYGSEAGRLQQKEGSSSIRHLDDAQLTSLLSYYKSLPDPSFARDALDLFFFSVHCCGLRISDIVTLEWAQIDRDSARLSKVMVKSKTHLSIPLSPSALQILERWRLRRPEGRFVFGLLPDDFDLEADAKLSRAIDNCNRTVGRRLNAAGRHLGFPFPLGMHMARHSFAVKALNSARVDIHLISHLLGHSSVLVTEKVYAKLLLPTLSKELNEKLSFAEFMIE